MHPTRTERQIDDSAMWSSLAIYLLTWSAILSAGFKNPLLLPSIAVSCLYVAMHVYEITVRGHCYLDADASALPVTLLTTVLGSLIAHFCLDMPWSAVGHFLARGAAACLAAHLAALAYSACVVSLARLCWRHRIEAERKQASPAPHLER